MKEGFNYLIDQIPSDIHSKTETHAAGDVILFKPTSYVVGKEIYTNDYIITLDPTSDPPPQIVEGREYQFKKKKLIVYTPETRVFLSTTDVPTSQFTVLCIKKDFFQVTARDAIGKMNVSFPSMTNPYSSKIVNLIRSFEEESKYSHDSSSMMLQSLNTQIVIQVLRETGNDQRIDGKRQPIDNNYIKRAIEYMYTYYNANIKIEDICKQIHLSPYYFIRMFKEATGQTPHDFLRSVRVKKAEEMLKKGNYSIEEVARLSGFLNTGHLSKSFKQVKGVPPSEYRRTHIVIAKGFFK